MQNYKIPRRQHRRKPRRCLVYWCLFRYNIKDMIMKEIIDKLDFINIKSFFFVKENFKRIRREATYWEEILTKDTCDKGLT